MQAAPASAISLNAKRCCRACRSDERMPLRTSPVQIGRCRGADPQADRLAADTETPRDRRFVDSLLEEAVSSEPVSETPITLLAGKRQGNSSILASDIRISQRKRY